MVSEVQVDDDRVAEELFKEQTTVGNNNKVKVTATTPITTNAGPVYDDRWGDIYEDMPAKRKLALYDYDPCELSPNVDAEVELSFRAGDIILVCKFYSIILHSFHTLTSSRSITLRDLLNFVDLPIMHNKIQWCHQYPSFPCYFTADSYLLKN